jgi:hypothetical protein
MKLCTAEHVRSTMAPLRLRPLEHTQAAGDGGTSTDRQLAGCAESCLEAHRAVVDWAQDVFAGRVVYDAGAEAMWRVELANLLSIARRTWQACRSGDWANRGGSGQLRLESALWHLSYLQHNWVTPKPSVAPSPRAWPGHDGPNFEAMRARVATLAR